MGDTVNYIFNRTVKYGRGDWEFCHEKDTNA